jgi:hypothetical protein
MGTTDDPNDPGLKDIGPDGLQAKYLVLSEEERAKGFVRPVRQQYLHVDCPEGGNAMLPAVTTMSIDLAQTYARDPGFYGGTYCAFCKTHRPVAEFVWVVDGDVTNLRVGS